MSSETSIFRITDEFLAIEEKLIENGGELTPEIETALAAVHLQLAQKVDAYAALIRKLDVTARMAREEAARVAGLAKVRENARDRLKERVKAAMVAMDLKRVEGATARFSICENGQPSVKWAGAPQDIPEEYRKTTVEYSVDRETVLQAVGAGVALPDGLTAERGNHLRIG